MTIRNLEKKDVKAVALLIPQLTKHIVEPEKLALRLEELTAAENCQWLVAESDDGVVGFGGLVWYLIPSKGLIGWLEEIVVDEKYRGQGIGKALVGELLKIAEHQHINMVKLTSTGAEASGLYQKFGFVKKEHEYFAKKNV